jgi:serine/threonine protein kinase
MHNKSLLHRDIKPENFLIGQKKKNFLIYVIDFGLAKRYKNSKTGEHIPFTEGKQLTGTARYASIYTHLGKEQSRRDDLESLGYILVYFLTGSLPWNNIQGKNKTEKYKNILDCKIKTVPKELCKDLPGKLYK